MEWTRQPNEDYSKAGEMYNELVKQFNLYMGHVAANIGGILTTPKTVEQAGPVYEYPSKSKQQRAMAFLQEQLFTTPMWLNDTQLAALTKPGFSVVTDVQKRVLLQLLSADVLDRLSMQENASTDAYTSAQFLRELKQGIFSELAAHKTIDTYRRGLQRIYVEKLLMMLIPGPQNPYVASPLLSKDGDGLPLVKAHAKALAENIKAAIPLTTDEMTRSHLQDLYDRLDNGLHPRK
jgi:hypothetical protein